MVIDRDFCKSCEQPKTNADFRVTKQGLHPKCHDCERAEGRQYYADHKDEYRARKAKYRANGKQHEWNAARYRKYAATEKARSTAWQRQPHVKLRLIEKRRELKRQVFEIYGGAFCRCCAETSLIMLTLDHMNNNGAAERKEWKSDGGVDGFYRKLKKRGFPDGYQVLCYNCNVAKYHNNGICPHEIERLKLAA